MRSRLFEGLSPPNRRSYDIVALALIASIALSAFGPLALALVAIPLGLIVLLALSRAATANFVVPSTSAMTRPSPGRSTIPTGIAFRDMLMAEMAGAIEKTMTSVPTLARAARPAGAAT
jgi:hypothetical protein